MFEKVLLPSGILLAIVGFSFCTWHFILSVRFFDCLEMHVLTFKCSFSMFIIECYYKV